MEFINLELYLLIVICLLKLVDIIRRSTIHFILYVKFIRYRLFAWETQYRSQKYDAEEIFLFACELGNLPIFNFFLERKLVHPDCHFTFGDKRLTGLQIASEEGHTEIVRLLLKDNRVHPEKDDNYAIRKASKKGHLEIVRLLLQHRRVDPSARSDTALQHACDQGHLEIVRLLLKDWRVYPERDNNEAIRLASYGGHLEIVRLLLNDKRVDPSMLQNWPVRSAAMNDHLEVVRLLMSDPRVNPSDMNNNAIYHASCNGNLEMIRLLLQDLRVDFNSIGYENMKQEIQREERNKLKQMLSFIYLTIEKSSPQISISGKIKSKIPKELIRKMALHACRDQIYLSYTRYRVLPFY